MTTRSALLATTTSLALAAQTAMGAPADNTVIPLWPEGVPQSGINLKVKAGSPAAVDPAREPSITYLKPAVDRAKGSAVIVIPGGGYSTVVTDREGTQYARWLGTLGITGFVLNYRIKDYGHPAPLQDIARAVRLVRSRAAEFGVLPDRIGAMGSSAGGHLAACAGTLFDHADARTGAEIDSVSARPDFLILMYPVITFEDPVAHAGSRVSLLGKAPTRKLLELLSVEKQVTARTPPTLLFHAQDDRTVPVENSILFYQALTRAKVPADMHLFQHGGHGFAMKRGFGSTSDWPTLAEAWLREQGVIPSDR